MLLFLFVYNDWKPNYFCPRWEYDNYYLDEWWVKSLEVDELDNIRF